MLTMFGCQVDSAPIAEDPSARSRRPLPPARASGHCYVLALSVASNCACVARSCAAWFRREPFLHCTFLPAPPNTGGNDQPATASRSTRPPCGLQNALSVPIHAVPRGSGRLCWRSPPLSATRRKPRRSALSCIHGFSPPGPLRGAFRQRRDLEVPAPAADPGRGVDAARQLASPGFRPCRDRDPRRLSLAARRRRACT